MRKLIDLLVALALIASCWVVSFPARSQERVVPGSLSQPANGNSQAFIPYSSSNPLPAAPPVSSHASTSALGTSLVAKAAPGNLFGYNCTGIAGGAAGYCIAYNGTSAPSTGALTGTLVLDFCYFDTSARGCSLSRIPNSVAYSVGIVILVTSASSPYTYTTGTDTAAISADYQ